MEDLAKAIVDSVHLFGQVLIHFSGNQPAIDVGNQISATSSIASIIGNLASFLAQLSTEMAKLIH
jgi:hypothetical protein